MEASSHHDSFNLSSFLVDSASPIHSPLPEMWRQWKEGRNENSTPKAHLVVSPNNLSPFLALVPGFTKSSPHDKRLPLLSSLRKFNVLGALCQRWDADQVNISFISHSINISSIFYSSLHEVTKVNIVMFSTMPFFIYNMVSLIFVIVMGHAALLNHWLASGGHLHQQITLNGQPLVVQFSHCHCNLPQWALRPPLFCIKGTNSYRKMVSWDNGMPSSPWAPIPIKNVIPSSLDYRLVLRWAEWDWAQ